MTLEPYSRPYHLAKPFTFVVFASPTPLSSNPLSLVSFVTKLTRAHSPSLPHHLAPSHSLSASLFRLSLFMIIIIAFISLSTQQHLASHRLDSGGQCGIDGRIQLTRITRTATTPAIIAIPHIMANSRFQWTVFYLFVIFICSLVLLGSVDCRVLGAKRVEPAKNGAGLYYIYSN